MSAEHGISLGLGLLSIGRTWGHVPAQPPSEADARRLLEAALQLGIRFFDTAPAYGASERIFGGYLRSLGRVPDDLIVATKMGEHWDADARSPFIDHSYDALCRSLEHSLALLGRIDVLQIHKATADVLRNDGVRKALEFARTAGIRSFGASVSDIEAAEAARDAGFYNYVQFPFNKLSIALGPIFGIASHSDMHVLVNRPFATGCILGVPDDERQNTMRNALSFIRNQQFAGAILVGTKSVMHLSENVSVFNAISSAHELGNSGA